MDAFVDLFFGKLRHLQAECDIIKHIQMREKGIALEHCVYLPLIGRYIVHLLAVEQNGAGSGI